jgi:hypothetical protein
VFVPLPPLPGAGALAPFAVIAVGMVAVTIFVFGAVLPSSGRPPLVTQMALALAVIGGGSVLLLALVFVFLNSDGTSAWTFVLLAFNFMMTGPAGLWFIGLVVFQDRRIAATGWRWPVALATMTTGSEVLMGFLFALGSASGPTSGLDTLALGVSSVWFFWSMAAIMVPLILWAPLARLERLGLIALASAAAIGPWVTSFPAVGGVAMALLMAALFAYLVRSVVLRRDVQAHQVGFLVALASAFLAMALAGLALVASGGAVVAVLAYGTVTAVVMTAEIAGLLRRYWLGSTERPWVARSVSEGDEPTGRPTPAASPLANAPPAEARRLPET